MDGPPGRRQYAVAARDYAAPFAVAAITVGMPMRPIAVTDTVFVMHDIFYLPWFYGLITYLNA
jgi:hypothetical protein